MPYKSTSDIDPGKRKGMTKHGAEIYKSAFNNALKQYGDEAKAHATANAAVTKAGERKESVLVEYSGVCANCGHDGALHRGGKCLQRRRLGGQCSCHGYTSESIESTWSEIVEDEGEKWMQDVHPKKGALHKQLGIPQDEKIPTDTLKTAAKKGGLLGKRANLALRYRGESINVTRLTNEQIDVVARMIIGDLIGKFDLDDIYTSYGRVRRSGRVSLPTMDEVDEASFSLLEQEVRNLIIQIGSM